jgi:hypothetical protein
MSDSDLAGKTALVTGATAGTPEVPLPETIPHDGGSTYPPKTFSGTNQ